MAQEGASRPASGAARPGLVLVGRVAGAFGVKGEVRLSAYTEDPMALLAYSPLCDAEGRPALTLLGARPVKDGVVARVKELTVKEAADALRGLRLYVPRERLPEPDEDEFYLADLIGLAVFSPSGEALGRIKGVHDYGAGDLLEIDPGQGRPSWLCAFTREAVPELDFERGRVVVDRPIETGETEPGDRREPEDDDGREDGP
jgi:16S rRNA processing protein RimM